MIAYLVAGDALHADAAEAIEAAMSSGSSLAMSAVNWCEVLQGALLGHYLEQKLREFVEDFDITIVPVDRDVAEQAAGLQAAYRATSRRGPRPRLRTLDGLILATSVVYADIHTLICGDVEWSKVPGVTADIVLLRERT